MGKLFYDLIVELHIREGFSQVLYQNAELFNFPMTRINYDRMREHFLRVFVYKEDTDRVEDFWNDDSIAVFIGNGHRPSMNHMEYRVFTKKGVRWIDQVTMYAANEGVRGGLMVLLRDVTDAKGERMDDLTEEDRKLHDLIGFPDIYAFYKNAEELLRKYPEKKFVLINTDINNFKLYEAIYGKEKAQKLLVMVATELKKMLTKTIGTVAYLGEDYFTC